MLCFLLIYWIFLDYIVFVCLYLCINFLFFLHVLLFYCVQYVIKKKIIIRIVVVPPVTSRGRWMTLPHGSHQEEELSTNQRAAAAAPTNQRAASAASSARSSACVVMSAAEVWLFLRVVVDHRPSSSAWPGLMENPGDPVSLGPPLLGGTSIFPPLFWLHFAGRDNQTDRHQ